MSIIGRSLCQWNISGYTFDQPQLSNDLETLQAAGI
jgi:hypothetical protein